MTLASRRGFTLIELLIVIGIIALLVVVLAFAVFPALAKGKSGATKAMLGSVATGLPSGVGALTIPKFKTDAGSSLASQIDSDPRKATSQMLLFYLAPGVDEWQNSRLYAGQGYAPLNQPEAFAEFTSRETGRMPYLVDSWDTPLWYQYDATVKAGYIMSAGPDKIWENDDDLIYDPTSSSVKERGDMKK